MTTTPGTPAIANMPPATRDGAGKPKAPSALERWVPIASRLPKYKWGSSRTPDLIAAISVATLLIPESISYATVADWRAATRRGEDTIMPAL